MGSKHMTLEELLHNVEFAHCPDDRDYWIRKLRAHVRECHEHQGCVPAYKVRACRNRLYRMSVDNKNMTYRDIGDLVNELLPPEPDPLDQAIEMLVNDGVDEYADTSLHKQLLILLQKAKEERRGRRDCGRQVTAKRCANCGGCA